MSGGGIRGQLLDEDGNAIQAMIRVTAHSLPGCQGARTDEDGKWCVPFLPIGNLYIVEFLQEERDGDGKGWYGRTVVDIVEGDQLVYGIYWLDKRADFPELKEYKQHIPSPLVFCPYCGVRLPLPTEMVE